MSIASQSPARPTLLRMLQRPRAVAFGCIIVLVAAGWSYLGLVLAGEYSGGLIAALCLPLDGLPGAVSLSGVAATFAMWSAMALAMMLPSAGPMITTYADLAETAGAKGEPAASPLVLTAGYIVVWLGAAAVLTLAQGSLARVVGFGEPAADSWFAAALFLIAGAYQFTSLKHACLTQCQNPFRFFFANWTNEPRGVFRLGVRQGLYCLGCCWAAMLLMFAVGTMNVLWMAALGVVTAIEKLGTSKRVSRVVGMLWLAIGAAIVVKQIIG